MFKYRLLSGIVLLAVIVTCGYFGSYAITGLCLFISLVGMFELYRVLKIQKTLFAYLGYAFAFLLYVGIGSGYFSFVYFVAGFIAMFLLYLCIYVFSYPRYRVDDVAKAAFTFIYVPVMIMFVSLARLVPIMGGYFMAMIFICSWGCDTCAYCVGVLFGRHKMSPVLSPKKSVEGAVGGVLGAMLLTFLMWLFFMKNLGMGVRELVILLVFAAIGAFISMVGDLAASAIKRNYYIKDYGRLIPGHGGILDRFDSVIITAPIIYFIALFIL